MKRKDDKTQRFELGATINVRRDDVDRLKNISKGDLENVNIGLGSDIGIGLGNAFSNGSAIMQAINNNREKRFNQLSEIGNEIQNEIDRLENDKELKRNIEMQNLEIAKNIEREIQLAKKQNMQLRTAINSANKKPSDISKINVKNENGYADLSSPTNEEFVSFNRKNSKNKTTNDIRNNIQSRADALYGSDEEYYKKYPKKEDKFSLYPTQNTSVDSEVGNSKKNDPPVLVADSKKLQEKGLKADINLFFAGLKVTENILNKMLEEIDVNEFINEVKPDKYLDKITNIVTYVEGKPVIRKINLTQYIDNATQKRGALENIIFMWNLSMEILYAIRIKDFILNRFNFSKIVDKLGDIDAQSLEILLEYYLNGSKLNDAILSPFNYGETAFNLKISAKDSNLIGLYSLPSLIFKQAKIYKNIESVPAEYQDTIKEKFKDIKDIKGVIFEPDSRLSKLLVSTREFKTEIRDNIREIIKKGNTSLEYKSGNMMYAFRKIGIEEIKFDPNNHLVGYFIDVSDYDSEEDNNLVKAGSKLQEKGIIVPRFEIIKFDLSPEDLQKIFSEKDETQKKDKKQQNEEIDENNK